MISKYNQFINTLYAFVKINLGDPFRFLDSGNPV